MPAPPPSPAPARTTTHAGRHTRTVAQECARVLDVRHIVGVAQPAPRALVLQCVVIIITACHDTSRYTVGVHCLEGGTQVQGGGGAGCLHTVLLGGCSWVLGRPHLATGQQGPKAHPPCRQVQAAAAATYINTSQGRGGGGGGCGGGVGGGVYWRGGGQCSDAPVPVPASARLLCLAARLPNSTSASEGGEGGEAGATATHHTAHSTIQHCTAPPRTFAG